MPRSSSGGAFADSNSGRDMWRNTKKWNEQKKKTEPNKAGFNSSSVMEEKIILDRLSHEATFFSRRYNQLNNQWPYAIVTTAVFCLKISCAANEIYSLTGKSNGDAASG